MSMLVCYSDPEDEYGHPPPDAKDDDLSENLEEEQLCKKCKKEKTSDFVHVPCNSAFYCSSCYVRS